MKVHFYLDKNILINKTVCTIDLPGYIPNWAVEHWENELLIFKQGAPLIQFVLPVERENARVLSIIIKPIIIMKAVTSTVFIIHLH